MFVSVLFYTFELIMRDSYPENKMRAFALVEIGTFFIFAIVLCLPFIHTPLLPHARLHLKTVYLFPIRWGIMGKVLLKTIFGIFTYGLAFSALLIP